MWQLLHTRPCPACGRPVEGVGGRPPTPERAPDAGASTSAPAPPHAVPEARGSALEQAWALFVAAPAPLVD